MANRPAEVSQASEASQVTPPPRPPVLHRSRKKKKIADSLHKSSTGSTSTCVFFLRDIPSFYHNSSHTSDPKMHHPAMDSLVLSLQCGKATAVFVPSKDCDIVAEVSKCGSRGLDLIFPVLYLSNHFTAVRAGTSTSRMLFFSGSCSKKQAYGTM